MLSHWKIGFLTFCISVVSVSQAYAEENKAEIGRDAIKRSVDVVTTDLTQRQREHFFLIYNAYNIVEATKMVQGDVKSAVKSCGKNNPEIKEQMESRFQAWNTAVDPVLKEASANIQNMIIAQDYAKAEDIQNVFNTIDSTRKVVDEQIVKEPVTTPDACEDLYEAMDDTQENLIALLKSSITTVPKAESRGR